MSRVFVKGWGAVSPAGWGAPALQAALDCGEPLPSTRLAWPNNSRTLAVCQVPAPPVRPSFLGHPRLRRASPITHHAAAAMLEALERAGKTGPRQPERLGLIVCMLAGCVQYTGRFFEEALKDPATASPLLFPETVFNAPASHLSVLLGRAPETCTLLGDPGAFVTGLALAAQWLVDERVDGCLVIGAEETNWLLASVLWLFDHGAVLAGGAGALYLERAGAVPAGVELSLVTDAHVFSSRQSRRQAAGRMRAELPLAGPGELLCDSRLGRLQADAAEAGAWRDWTGPRLSPKQILGDGLMASGAWQCAAACAHLARGGFSAANVSVAGTNQQAIGARFVLSGGSNPGGPAIL